jgi:hypothetical protein
MNSKSKQMKQSVVICMLLLCNCILAQPGGRSSSESLLDVPVLTGRSSATTIQPTLGPICFDKKIKIISNANRGQLETCLFINTRMGIIGYTSYKLGKAGSCTIDPMTDGFRFTVMTLRGNVYQYVTNEKRGRLEHRVITHNSDFYYSSLTGERPGSGATGTIRKLNETGSYPGGIRTAAYQAAGSTAKFHLYGANLPAQINATSATKHLGMYGVGYSTFGNKVYLVMEMINNEESVSAITSIENVNVCFNSEIFGILEDEMYQKTKSKIQQDRERIMNDYSISSGPCAGNDLTIKNHKLESLNRQEAYLEKTMQGNRMNDRATQQAMVNMYGYEDQVQLAIYEKELNICNLEDRQGRPTSRLSAEDFSRKMNCYRQELRNLNTVKAELATVARRFPNEPGRQLQEKQRLMISLLRPCNE